MRVLHLRIWMGGLGISASASGDIVMRTIKRTGGGDRDGVFALDSLTCAWGSGLTKRALKESMVGRGAEAQEEPPLRMECLLFVLQRLCQL